MTAERYFNISIYFIRYLLRTALEVLSFQHLKGVEGLNAVMQVSEKVFYLLFNI